MEGYTILEKLDEVFTVCKAVSSADVDLEQPYCFVGKTKEELSVVCPVEHAPVHALEREDGWRSFRIRGVLDFSLIGILSKIAGILAENSIGIFAVSTFNTDYVFTKAEDFERALSVLTAAGYSIAE